MNLRSVTKQTLRWAVLPLALIALGVGWLAYTASGARWLVTTGAGMADVDLRYARLDGSLARGLDVEGFQLHLPSATLRAEHLHLRWQPLAFLRGALHVERLALTRAEVTIRPRTDTAPATGFDLPLPIDVASLDVEKLAVTVDGTRHLVERATAELHAAGDMLALREVDMLLPPHRVRGVVELAEGGAVLDVVLDYSGELDGTRVAGTVSLDGPRTTLRTALALSAPITVDIDGTLNLDAASPVVDLRGMAALNAFLASRGATMQMEALDFTLRGSPETLALHAETKVMPSAQPALGVTVDATRVPGADPRVALRWQLTPATPLFGIRELAGAGDVAWRSGRVEIEQTLTAPSPLRLSAKVTPGTPLAIEAQAEWEALALEFANAPLRSPHGRLTLRGPWPGVVAELDAEVEEPQVGIVGLKAQATLSTERIDAIRADARLLDGELALRGALSSLAPLAGVFDVRARAIDLSRLREGLDTRLAADASLTLAGQTVAVDLERASGPWRGHELDARGALQVDLAARRLDARDLAVSIGRNRLTLSGQVDDTLALDFALDAPAIAELDDALAGRLHGKGTLRGKPAAPVLEATLDGAALRADTLAADAASLRAHLAPAARTTLRLRVDGLRQDDTRLGPLALDAAGTAEAHTLTLDAGDGVRSLALRAQGVWKDRRYAGRLQDLALAWPTFGTWQLDGDTDFRYAGAALDLEPLCLAQSEARVCIDAKDLTPESGRVHAALDALPTALAAPWLPADLAVDGTVSGEVSAAHARGGWRPRGQLQGANVGVVIGRDAREGTRWPLAPLTLVFEDVDEGSRFALAMANAELGSVDARGTLTAADPPGLDAVVQAEVRDLRAIARLVPDLDGSAGRLTLDAKVHGELARPVVEATAELATGQVRLERLGIELDAARLDATMSTPSRMELKLALGQGEQRLRASGHLERAPDWPFALRVESERFSVVRRSDLELDVAPALSVSGTREEIDLAGSIALPRLQLRMTRQAPDVVAVSADEVIVDESGDVVPREAPASAARVFWRDHVSAALKFLLGDDARVQALGLDASLRGAIDFSKARGSPGFANGRITLKNGHYVAYRQTLDLKRGELRFNGPLDNPSLDVLALRPKLDIDAGVVVTGTAQAPIVRLYSDPAMADLETLSYVVTGRPLGSKRSNADMLAQAALGLGLEQAEGLTSQLRAWFGLDELGVNAGSTVEGTNFVAGKQLTPRMRVRSEFNPFDRLWSVFLNYRLTEHWSVEGESGARQGADVIYSIERDTLF